METPPVLYVEDDKNDVLFMKLAFQAAALPYPLQIVWNGQEGLDYLAGAGKFSDRKAFPSPLLVLLDLNLPLKSGFEVLEWIRHQPPLQSLPVVIFSSSAQTHDIERAGALGASEYVEKLSNPTQLGTVLKRLEATWLLPHHA
ncbi:MAG: two-component system response regulator [Verrucomicrobiales bacterium]|nr:two-component system response regulator [Verrucomicrobiales bacterium]